MGGFNGKSLISTQIIGPGAYTKISAYNHLNMYNKLLSFPNCQASNETPGFGCHRGQSLRNITHYKREIKVLEVSKPPQMVADEASQLRLRSSSLLVLSTSRVSMLFLDSSSSENPNKDTEI